MGQNPGGVIGVQICAYDIFRAEGGIGPTGSSGDDAIRKLSTDHVTTFVGYAKPLNAVTERKSLFRRCRGWASPNSLSRRAGL